MPPDRGIDGIDLARAYYQDVVRPLLDASWPHLPHAAGLLGAGSDVLGLDDVTSRDHDWGLRLTLLVEAGLVAEVDRALEAQLPERYRGLATRFAFSGDPVLRHRIDVDTAEGFVTSRIGLDAARGLSIRGWLALTGQSVLEVVAGPVFADTLGTITRLREGLAWYPDDVWRYCVAADWVRLDEELPLLGRAGDRGDDLGSRVIAGRLVGIAVHLAFLLSRRWPPYPKWRGTALMGLPIAAELVPALSRTLAAPGWEERQGALGEALAVLFRLQRQAGLPASGAAPTGPFWDRPFLAIRSDVVGDLLADVAEPALRDLPPGLGSIEQWVDHVLVLTDPSSRAATAGPVLAALGRTRASR